MKAVLQNLFLKMSLNPITGKYKCTIYRKNGSSQLLFPLPCLSKMVLADVEDF